MLKVIGAGVGRTGTNSFRLAMERLGFGKCHHMVEVIDNPGQAPKFLAAARGEPVDWHSLYQGYRACTDWPSCHFWRQLSQQFPDARVVLTVRDPDSWYRSMAETILASLQQKLDTVRNPLMDMGEEILFRQFFQGNVADRDHVIACFERHNQAVREAIPAHRLLEFEASQGWQPLCDFLDVPVPDEPYPVTNSPEEFKVLADRVV